MPIRRGSFDLGYYSAMSESIPKPPGALPGIGHLRLLDSTAPVQSLLSLANQMGEIFALDFPGGGEMICVSSQRLVHELCD